MAKVKTARDGRARKLPLCYNAPNLWPVGRGWERRLERKYTRKYPRISAKFSVEYSVGNKTFREHASTLGGGGLFLTVRQAPPMGSEVVVRFRPAKHLPLMEVKGKVCYQVPGQGIALEFTNINPEYRQLLLRLIHHKIGDKRKHARARLVTQIECSECTSLAFSRDVSLGGMFIETKRPLAIGSRINMRFNLDDGRPVIVAAGEVTYQVVKLGMGVTFVELVPADKSRLEAYVAKSPKLFDPTGGTKAAP